MTDAKLPDIVNALRGAAALLTAAFAGTVPREWGSGAVAAADTGRSRNESHA
jgi:hypothetical protein